MSATNISPTETVVTGSVHVVASRDAIAELAEHGVADPIVELHRRERVYRLSLLAADWGASLIALAAAVLVFGGSLSWLTLAVPPIAAVLSKVQGLYDHDDRVIHKARLGERRDVIEATLLITVAMYLMWRPLTGESQPGGMRMFAFLWIVLSVGVLTLRVAARAIAQRLSPAERCLIIGRRSQTAELSARINALPGVELIGVAGAEILDGTAQELDELVRRLGVHRLITAVDDHVFSDQMAELTRNAKWIGVRVSLFPNLLTAVGGVTKPEDLDGMTLLGMPRFGLSRSSAMLKRIFDLVAAVGALIVLSPLYAVLSLLVRLDSPGPVFFRQTRVGRNGHQFQMIKFRSMCDDAEAMKQDLRTRNEAGHGLFKIVDDPRITRTGRWMRKAHIDELPQLWNVARGEMSLVGPRPLVPDEDRLIMGSGRHRLRLTPGMTGPWQVKGPMSTPLEEMAKLDYRYIANWSLWQDLDIILKTIGKVLRRGGH